MGREDERGLRWSSTRRTAGAGAVLGSAGGAVTGSLSLLGDDALGAGPAVAFGVLYGAPSGAVLGALLGLVSGAVGGCLAVHLVRRHTVLARAVLALCCGLLTSAVAAWVLPPGPVHLVGTVVTGSVAAAVAWASAPWCFRPLGDVDGPVV